jgi:hypothetical protein
MLASPKRPSFSVASPQPAERPEPVGPARLSRGPRAGFRLPVRGRGAGRLRHNIFKRPSVFTDGRATPPHRQNRLKRCSIGKWTNSPNGGLYGPMPTLSSRAQRGGRNSSGVTPAAQAKAPPRAREADTKKGGFFDETALPSVALAGADYSSPSAAGAAPSPSPSPAATAAAVRAEGAAAMMSARSSKPASTAAAAWSIVSSRSTLTLR